MTWMRRVTEYLGLAPDDEYDDYDEVEERDERQPATRAVTRPTQPTSRVVMPPQVEPERSASVRSLNVQRAVPAGAATDYDDEDRVVARAQGPVVVRPQESPVVARPLVVTPSSFSSAQEVADKFKATRPVIMNLQGLDRDLQRRLIDFASGLCYGLGGQMDKVADQVFLLTPADVEVPDEERRRISETGLYRT